MQRVEEEIQRRVIPQTFDPSGKLIQIEHALRGVRRAYPSVGLRTKDGVVLATRNKSSILYEEEHKIDKISDHIGCAYSGFGPDFRLLARKAREIATEYDLTYREEIPTTYLVIRLATVMQEYTHSVRPYGVSLLIAGWDKQPPRPLLFKSDPSGAYFACKATALGKNDHAKTFLENRFNEALDLDDGIRTALLSLRNAEMNENNVEVAICTSAGFRRLTKQQVRNHLAAL
ncbi:CRE-PAS-2 protein [Aphelenchoides avenae]|nr:CRE-PAS-2 protein [Aphelenchus avenae]